MSRPHRSLLLVLCAATSLLFAQKKTPAVQTKTPTELSMERQGLVDLRSVDPSIQGVRRRTSDVGATKDV